jgi:hypothetical protein
MGMEKEDVIQDFLCMEFVKFFGEVKQVFDR